MAMRVWVVLVGFGSDPAEVLGVCSTPEAARAAGDAFVQQVERRAWYLVWSFLVDEPNSERGE